MANNNFDRENNVYKGDIDEYELVDLASLFQQYVQQYIKDNDIDPEEEESFEDDIADMYLEWLDKYNEELECKPIDYFKPFNASQLIQILIKYTMAHIKLPDPLIEEIINKKEQTAQLLLKVLEYEDNSHFSVDIKLTVMNILSEMEYKLPLMQYIAFIEKGDEDDILAQTAYEIIDEHIEENEHDIILDVYDSTKNLYAKKTYLDIMARFTGNEEAYEKLINAFINNISDENVAFYAACLAKFGDDRAVQILEEALKENDFNYLNFTAIKHAIEQLGDFINIERTFDGDSTYELLKNIPDDQGEDA